MQDLQQSEFGRGITIDQRAVMTLGFAVLRQIAAAFLDVSSSSLEMFQTLSRMVSPLMQERVGLRMSLSEDDVCRLTSIRLACVGKPR